MSDKKNTFFPPFFIMLASSLWAIDALFRTQLTYTIPPAMIVFIEHTLGFLFLSPILFRNWQELKTLNSKDWLTVLTMTIVSSVLGGLLFTAALEKSFANFDFVTPVLLQKLQPVFVIGLSAIFLKERLTIRFLSLAALALIGSYLISFGNQIVSLQIAGKELVYLLALGAAFCWGSGTILSKSILNKLDFPTATSLRFLMAIPVSIIFALGLGQTSDVTTLGFSEIWRFLVIAGITGGAFSLLIYYKGLKNTQAKISTIAELMFVVVSILIAVTSLNPYGEPQQLNVFNIVGILLLVSSILAISLKRK